MQTTPSPSLGELARLFLRLGTLAFGGPAAHIAMMEDEVVTRRQWLTRHQLLDLIGATNLIPGPNSTELAIHIGFARCGWRGLIVAGTCFIVPAMLIVWLLAVVYMRYQTLPQVDWLFYGIKPVIVAIVFQALWRLGQSAVKGWLTGIVGGLVIVLSLLDVSALALLLGAGLAVMLAGNWRGMGTQAWWTAVALPGTLPTTGAAEPSGLAVFGFFLKVGSVLYGSGYVLLAFLQKDLVERWQWLTSDQLLDAVAIGQLTPGPVFTTATFIGYMLAGHSGALVATLGIFLPSFIFVAAVNPWVPYLRRSPWTSHFLDGVVVASMGLMAVVAGKLATTALVDVVTIALAILSGIALFRFQVNSAWLILGGAAVGLGFHLW
ncbi:MAG: chromate transporter [Candidatus Entotheonella factor]|uniref:Chromate transporter n=1 Tax=Entotheonella factor TaxID=1429438 RepID=W4L7M4_ENTF1|nr:chromate efflux transporter [Candidatus Entotheonella palauensis]ETW94078.1 MAG: chromate transporter [Candidatus Entotheonella factor]